MEKLYWSVDFEEIHCPDQSIRYEIGGWAAAPNGRKVAIELYADGDIRLPYSLKIEERPDVQQAIEDVTKRTDIGWRLVIGDARSLWEQYRSVTLFLTDGKTRIKALERSTAQIRELYFDKTITWKIDIIDQIEGLMTIQGWVIGMFHDETIALVDENGTPVPHDRMKIIRTDVNQAYEVGKEAENDPCGFQIRIRRKEIFCKELHLQFRNRLTMREYVVDLKKFDYEHSRKGKIRKILSLKNRKENSAYIREHGLREFARYVNRQAEPVYADYSAWKKEHSPSKKEIRRQRAGLFSYRPKISIVIPLYNTPDEYLKVMIDSLLAQTYENFEICLADGSSGEGPGDLIRREYGGEPRVRYRKLGENRGISGNTNVALAMADGDYLMLADHDDIVEPDALFSMVQVLNEDPATDVIYTDEDKVSMDGKWYYAPNFKSDFNIDLLRSVNYICHIFLVRRELAERTGGFRSAFDGAQDYDFILRCIEMTDRIHHVPRALYHWRAHPDSTAGNPASKQYAVDAGVRAIREHYDRMGIAADVTGTEVFGIYRTVYRVQGEPTVSVIIPNKDHIDDLKLCVMSILEKTTYRNFEILIVENNSERPETFAYYEELEKTYSQVRVVYWQDAFNYAAINNFGAARARGDYLILLNNDIEVIAPDWMEEMLGCVQRDDVGIVGAKLFYPDGSIQHAGVVLGMGGIAGHVYCRGDGKDYGYNARLITMQDISAVTAACLMIPKRVYHMVDGFDERYSVAFNDIDLCMKVRALGKLIVFNPYVTLYHYESKSRGLEDTPEKRERFRTEVEYFQEKWKDVLAGGDPYYNPNLTLLEGDCSLKRATEE